MIPTVSGGIVSDIISQVRQIIKFPSDQAISDVTIADFINRFYVYDMPARIQLFELKRQYTFETNPNVNQYQFPYGNYQNVRPPVYCDGVEIGYFQFNQQFYRIYPEQDQNLIAMPGKGSTGPYNYNFSTVPILSGFRDDLGNLLPAVYFTATDVNGVFRYIVDDGNGNLLQTDNTFNNGPFGPNTPVPICGTIDYVNGIANFQFPTPIGASNNIFVQYVPYTPGVPRMLLFFNNIMKLFPCPDRAYKIQLDCQITPAQFLDTSQAVPFAYMSEYLARGAARKIMIAQADTEQVQFYESFFREQENFVLRRTSRQQATQRTPTIFSTQVGDNTAKFSTYGS